MSAKKFEMSNAYNVMQQQDKIAGKGSVIEATIKAAKKPKAKRKSDETVRESVLSIKRETKSKRLNLLIKPSVFERVEAAAKDLGISVNEFANFALLSMVEKYEEEN